MRALITGATGFVGTHLTRELENAGYDVHRASQRGFDKSMRMDMLHFRDVRSVIRRVNPDIIFHLAAVAYVPASWQQPRLTLDVNLIGTLHLFDAVRSLGLDPTILIAGSSEEYGLVKPNETPIKEDQPLRPLSPYAVSKIAMSYLGYQYFKSYGMRIIRTRAFNHEGWGRGEQYMPSGFAKQIVLIEKGLQDPVIKHGNLEAGRDITDVRDITHAYRLATERCDPGEVYNIGIGKAYTVEYVLERLITLSALTHPLNIEKVQDPQKMRPSDVPLLVADASKFKKKTDWMPRYSLDSTLKEELEYWRKEVNKPGKRT